MLYPRPVLTGFSPRGRYITWALVTVALGLASRRWRAGLPGWVGAYAGDALWALLVFWLISAVGPRRPAWQRAAAAWAVAQLVEVSQLWQAPWLQAVRGTWLGALVLGRGFLWSDVLSYTAGILLGLGLDAWLTRRRPQRAA
ncbi:DUF2809 domain-containing protein [Hymenobacter coalescens]